MTAPTSVALTRLESFLAERRTLNRETFLQKYSTPMLVIALNPEGGALEDDGAFRTQVVTSDNGRNPFMEASKTTAVVPVQKRMADAFQAFIWVGRESRCDVALPFDSVSKLQAQFVKRPTGEFDLIDAGSTNGTFVEENRLEKNKPTLIRDSTRIRFGKIDTRFRTAEGFWDELGRYL